MENIKGDQSIEVQMKMNATLRYNRTRYRKFTFLTGTATAISDAMFVVDLVLGARKFFQTRSDISYRAGFR